MVFVYKNVMYIWYFFRLVLKIIIKIMWLGVVKFYLLIMLIRCYFEILEFWEGVYNDIKYDIEIDGGYEDEEWYVVNYD